VILQGTPTYKQWESSFWSQQQGEVNPGCIFQPVNSSEVSVGLLLSRFTQCPFAIKSGGHAAFAGASNIRDGITFDMGALNSISLSPDNKVAHIGTGNRWHDVYTALEPHGLSVIGGRVADIGVGGLTLGGELRETNYICGFASF
jgi:FAD/FMN-containing dehydrogenase